MTGLKAAGEGAETGLTGGAARLLDGSGEMPRRMRDFDWSRTPLGPAAAWSGSLETLVGLMLASRQPMFMAWGPERTWFYNDAFIPILGDKHPAALGEPALQVWGEARAELTPLFDRVFAGQSVRMDDISLMLDRRGRLEEAHFAFSYTPARDESGAVAGLFGVCIETTEQVLAARQRGDNAARDEQLRLATEAAEIGFWDVDNIGDTLYWPPRVKAMFGISPDAPASMADFYSGIHPDDRDATAAAYEAANDPERRALYDVEYRTVGKEDGAIRWVAAKGRGIFDEQGRCVRVIGTAIDITARKATEARLRELNETLERRVEEEVGERMNAEAALRQAQKMEAIGHLTGGIAHDFNNLLQVVLGNLDVLRRRFEGDAALADEAGRRLSAALHAAERAAGLTRRLLAFSRQQPLDARPVDVNRLLRGMSDLLRRTLGEKVAVETRLASSPPHVLADLNQLESAILNLAVNARDAMPDGGTLLIESGTAVIDAASSQSDAEIGPGSYATISVSDNGVGMTPEVAAAAFNPFFTTKEPGHGTGLGLSQVYGFVRQSAGHVRIDSAPGRGTVVHLYLPSIPDGVALAEEARERTPPAGGGNETILLVEDDAAVRELNAGMLRELGYTVIAAHDAAEALDALGALPSIALLFSDIGLPGAMNGRRLADGAAALRPGLKILLTTGYERNAAAPRGRLDPGIELIAKPFSQAALAAKLRAVLDRR